PGRAKRHSRGEAGSTPAVISPSGFWLKVASQRWPVVNLSLTKSSKLTFQGTCGEPLIGKPACQSEDNACQRALENCRGRGGQGWGRRLAALGHSFPHDFAVPSQAAGHIRGPLPEQGLAWAYGLQRRQWPCLGCKTSTTSRNGVAHE